MPMLSIETQELAEEDIATFVQENFAAFLIALRHLWKEDQELLLSCYYVLGKAEHSLALLNRAQQTHMSFKTRMGMKKLGTFLMLWTTLRFPANLRPISRLTQWQSQSLRI